MRMKLGIACISLLILTHLFTSVSKVLGETESYTYTYEYFGNMLESPDAYTPEALLLGSHLGIGDFNNPSSLFVRDEDLYIVDSGNNRIVVVNKFFELIRIIDKVMIDGQENTLLNPSDIFVAEGGEMYICDTGNNRVLHVDSNLNGIKTYVKPDDPTVLEETNFIPLKSVADKAGRLFVLAANVNQGFMEYDRFGEFSNFIGANPVKASFFQAFSKRLMTKEQRDRMILFVPTEYSNLAIDKDDFLYATTTTFTEEELRTMDSVRPIRKLNSLGQDILVRNGYEDQIGDVQTGSGGDVSGPSRFQDVTPMDNDTYYCLDRNRGRIFAYDFQGNLLYVFGGLGNKLGYFQYPVSIEHMGTDIFVLDNRSVSVTRFTLTDFGSYINKGLLYYKQGRYEESAKYWKKALFLNGNYDQAYIGIGRALLRSGEYEEAMKYFEAKRDVNSYSKAFARYRKEWVEENIKSILTFALALIIIPIIIGGIKKRVRKMNTKQVTYKGRLKELLESLRYSLYVIFHPFDGFWDLIHEKRGSFAAATVIFIMVILTQVWSWTYSSFPYYFPQWEYFNLFMEVIPTIVLFFIWCIANWSLTTLMDGKGKLGHIYMASAYALSPYVLIRIPLIFLTYVLTLEESAYYSLFAYISFMWCLVLMIAAMMMIHDYTIGKALFSSLLTIVTMMVIIFLIVIFFSLITQSFGYFVALYKEVAFRLY